MNVLLTITSIFFIFLATQFFVLTLLSTFFYYVMLKLKNGYVNLIIFYNFVSINQKPTTTMNVSSKIGILATLLLVNANLFAQEIPFRQRVHRMIW